MQKKKKDNAVEKKKTKQAKAVDGYLPKQHSFLMTGARTE